jgi:ATP-dependent DNA helicase RecQ
LRQWPSARLWWSGLPQVYHTSFSAESGNSRVDFLLVSASGDTLVVEIDGAQHKQQRSKDQSRDQFLANLGINTIRIPVEEIRSGNGPQLTRLRGLLAKTRVSAVEEALQSHSPLTPSLRLFKFLHQVQLACLEALRTGWLNWHEPWVIRCDIPSTLGKPQGVHPHIHVAIRGLVELLERLSKLHGADCSVLSIRVVSKDDVATDIHLVIQDGQQNMKTQEPTVPAFYISDILFPGEIAAPTESSYPAAIAEPSKDDGWWFLNYIFRKDNFWEGQWETIKRTLQGKDSVVLLPTGGGKSIAFQLAALLLPGRCIAVDPIIALIDDQIDNLRSVGIDRTIGITSQIHSRQLEQALDTFASGHYLFCYVAPERFQTAPFRECLRALTVASPVSVIAVDEAHCVSQWGHDFRTAYLNLGRIAREYCSSSGTTPPLVALTGTASKIVRKDVQRELGITDIEAIITPSSFDRPELHFSVLSCQSSEKTSRVLGFLNRLPSDFGMSRGSFFQPAGDHTASGLVLCPFVNSEFGVVQHAEELSKDLGIPVRFYSGGAPRGFNPDQWNEVKQDAAARFKRNQDPLMVCTKAYGMGIDKPNVRYTIHLDLPESIESFYQEAGRAGRDKQRAECAIIVSDDHPGRSERLLSPNASLEEIAREVENIPWQERDDVVRALWFHIQAFKGEAAELDEIQRAIVCLEPLSNYLKTLNRHQRRYQIRAHASCNSAR